MTVGTNWFGTPQQIKPKIDQTRAEYPWSTESDGIILKDCLELGLEETLRAFSASRGYSQIYERQPLKTKKITEFYFRKYVPLTKWLSTGRTLVHCSPSSMDALRYASLRRAAYGLSDWSGEDMGDDHPFRHKCVVFSWPKAWSIWHVRIQQSLIATERIRDYMEHGSDTTPTCWVAMRRSSSQVQRTPFYTFAYVDPDKVLRVGIISCGPYPTIDYDGEKISTADFYNTIHSWSELPPTHGAVDSTWECFHDWRVTSESTLEVDTENRDRILSLPKEILIAHRAISPDTVTAITALAFQALAFEEQIIVYRKPRRGSKKARTRLKGVKNIRPIELDESGLFTWSKKILYKDAFDKGIKLHSSDRLQRIPGGPKTLHVVNPFMGIRWVRKPLPGEKILKTREGKKSTLFAVKRYVKRHTRGQDIHLDEGRMFVKPSRWGDQHV